MKVERLMGKGLRPWFVGASNDMFNYAFDYGTHYPT